MADEKTETPKEEPRPASGGRWKKEEGSDELILVEPPTAPEAPPKEETPPRAPAPEPQKETEDAK